ncbi:DUF805 domain-containing protein [Allorhizobium borbori]|uniref:Uncharacterized membrane protein YhaH (DUF805 family) n=1 Tax=Allorhizobium borbori TaxID=485907 RepID=A0A7W6P1H2_9HYPH|nr:DUF805 domain-containing protein [Allorhizobium borbori]MBB4104374.1 uncharacterized membrane protein YhaH (DUF805 family) [Allorhizobium borbori]
MSRLFYLLFSFSGRIGRLSFALGTLAQIILIASGFATLVFSFVLTRHGAKIDETVMSLWMAPIFMFAVWSSLALSSKRLHDRDLSGLWTLIAFIPGVGTVWWLAQTFGMQGTTGENRYGMPPGHGRVLDADEEDDLDRRINGVSVRAARYAGIPDILKEASAQTRSRGGAPALQNGIPRAHGFGRRRA